MKKRYDYRLSYIVRPNGGAELVQIVDGKVINAPGYQHPSVKR